MKSPRQPTVGRIVHFYSSDIAKPQAAIITAVWTPDMVNIHVFAPAGNTYPVSSVNHRGTGYGATQTWDWPEIVK